MLSGRFSQAGWHGLELPRTNWFGMIVTLPPIRNTAFAQSRAPGNYRSFILYERGWRRYHWEGASALSIKTFLHGQALYDVGSGRYAVREDQYLILNQGQTYALTIDAPQALDSFCVFFAPGFAEQVQHSLTAGTRQLLDDPDKVPPSLHFFERTYTRGPLMGPALRHLRLTLAHRREDYGWLEEQFHVLMQKLLHVHRHATQEAEALPALRRATREELYRRLHRARDFMQACFHQPVRVEELARVACLSTNHFLRTFKQAFQRTPHQYLTELRLRHAQELLRRSEASITEICDTVGFTSLGSFSWLFRRYLGVAPESYRRQKR